MTFYSSPRSRVITGNLPLVLLLFTAFSSLLLSSCNLVDQGLLGRWGTNQSAWFEFTADSGFLVGTPPASTDPGVLDQRTRYEYSASGGSGSYWDPDFPGQAINFTYTVSGDILELALPWASFRLERIVP